MRRLIASLALVVLAAPAAIAEESFYQKHFAPPCYARSYDAAHLAAHPLQRVTYFYVTGGDFGEPDTGAFIVDFGFLVKNSPDVFYGSASCDSTMGAAQCWAEGDAGTFTLEASGDGLRVGVGDHLTLEGNASFSPDLGRGGDDKVIILHPESPLACIVQ
ncbi:MAG: hypothetical protein RLT05_25750 [Bauldia litoralis]